MQAAGGNPGSRGTKLCGSRGSAFINGERVILLLSLDTVGAAASLESADSFLLGLSDRLRRIEDPARILYEAAASIGPRLGLSRAGYAEVDPEAGTLYVERDWTDGTVKPGVGQHIIASFGMQTTAMLYSGETQRIDDVRVDPRIGRTELSEFDAMSIVSAITVPLVREGRLQALFSVHKPYPCSWSEADVRLVEQVAHRTFAAHELANTAARLRDSEARLAFLLELSDRTRRESDVDAILRATSELLVGQLNGARVVFGEFDQQARRMLVKHDSGKSVSVATYIDGFSDFGDGLVKMLKAGQTFVSPDALADPRISMSPSDPTTPSESCSVITRALTREGRITSYLSVQDLKGRRWSDMEVRLVEEVAERTWATLARAHAEEELRRTEGNRAFLLSLADQTRLESDPGAILATTAELLGNHLNVLSVTYANVDMAGGRLFLTDAWGSRGADRSLEYPLSVLGKNVLAAQVRGAVFQSDDIIADPRLEAPLKAACEARGVRSLLTAPLVKEGCLTAFLSVDYGAPRRWTSDEAELLAEVAERTWANLARASTAATLKEREASSAFLLELGDRLRDLSSAAEILGEVVEAAGCKLAASRVGYAETDVLADKLAVNIEWGDGTLAPIAGRSRLSVFGRNHLAALGRGETARIDDTAHHPHIDDQNRATFEGIGIRAAITVPLVRRGELVALFSVHHATPRAWTDSEVRLVEEIAGRTWAVLDRAGAEAELRRSEERLRLAVDGASIGTWAWDVTEQRGWWSGRTYDIFGLARNVEIGLKQLEMFYPGDRDRVFNHIRCAMKEGREFALDFRIVRGDGSIRWVSSRGVADRTVDGQATHMTGVILDVHDRKVAEEELRQSQALLAAFMANAPVGMYLKDASGRYVMANAGMERIFQRPAREVIGRHADELFDEPTRLKVAAQDRIALEAGRAQTAEQFLPGGTDENWTLVIRFPIDLGPQGIRIGGFAIDMSEQKRAEADLARSREALYQSEKLTALGSLLAGVSHELNNPLSIVVAQAAMMEEDTVGSPLAKRSAKICAAAERCAKIVQTFLAMARQQPPKRRRVEINDVVRGALELTAYGLRSDGVELICELADDLPAVEGDADQLHQLVANLVINAQQALQEVPGARRLRVITGHGSTPGTVVIELADNGRGIPAEHRRRVFEPFFTTKPQGVGTGLGLSFSLGVAEAHGGSLELSEASSGATFRVTLPASSAPPLAAATVKPDNKYPAHGAALIVDDEAEISETLAELLQKQGWQVEVASSGAEAQRLIAMTDYDLILSDLRMPGVDGLALQRWIAANKPHLLDRLGFVTGDTMGQSTMRFLSTSGQPTLEKPFTPQSLSDFVLRIRPALSA